MAIERPQTTQPPGPGQPASASVNAQEKNHSWGMVIDIDRCTGCQACVVACKAENNIPINTEEDFLQRRAKEWIRIERYWEGEFPNVKARFLPVLCQQCGNAPCEPVCPVYATYHNPEGLNAQIYNRCVGTRFCANNCPYDVRFFNWKEPEWADPLNLQLNPDVTVRSKGIMEKCTFCVQRISRTKRDVEGREGRPIRDGELQPACAQTCPTDAIIFGDWADPNSRISILANDRRNYELLGHLGTEPTVVYLKKVDPNAAENEVERGSDR